VINAECTQKSERCTDNYPAPRFHFTPSRCVPGPDSILGNAYVVSWQTTARSLPPAFLLRLSRTPHFCKKAPQTLSVSASQGAFVIVSLKFGALLQARFSCIAYKRVV
jgi:hypothetical protein